MRSATGFGIVCGLLCLALAGCDGDGSLTGAGCEASCRRIDALCLSGGAPGFTLAECLDDCAAIAAGTMECDGQAALESCIASATSCSQVGSQCLPMVTTCSMAATPIPMDTGGGGGGGADTAAGSGTDVPTDRDIPSLAPDAPLCPPEMVVSDEPALFACGPDAPAVTKTIEVRNRGCQDLEVGPLVLDGATSSLTLSVLNLIVSPNGAGDVQLRFAGGGAEIDGTLRLPSNDPAHPEVTVALGCEPAFGDPCTTNLDCLSGYCVPGCHEDGPRFCTVMCIEDCPAGYSCRTVSEAPPDIVFVCLPDCEF